LRYVLDADVAIGALDGSDAHHEQARALFTTWRAQDDSALMSVVNLSEVLVAPASDPRRLQAARTAIAALGVAIHSPTEAIGVDASRLRARHRISLPDAYLLATARQLAGTVVSFDRKVTAAAAAEGIPRLGPGGP
jgi:predicted nucleic acid-binding protein